MLCAFHVSRWEEGGRFVKLILGFGLHKLYFIWIFIIVTFHLIWSSLED